MQGRRTHHDPTSSQSSRPHHYPKSKTHLVGTDAEAVLSVGVRRYRSRRELHVFGFLVGVTQEGRSSRGRLGEGLFPETEVVLFPCRGAPGWLLSLVFGGIKVHHLQLG